MEPLFINSYKRTKKTFKELYSFLYFKRTPRKVLFIFLAIFVLISLLISLAAENLILFDLALFVFLITYLSAYAASRSAAKIMFAVDSESTGGEGLTHESLFFEDHFEIKTSNHEVINLDYKVINRVYVRKKIVVIVTKAGAVYTLENNAFTQGQMYELIIFLQNKEIKIK